MTVDVPPYQCQYADRDRVGEFLDQPGALATDARWADFGFASPDEYAHWAPRLCGVACVQMVLAHHGLQTGDTMAVLTRAAVAAGAYGSHGWAYGPLVELTEGFGLRGAVRPEYSLAGIAADLAAGQHPVASVHPRVIRGELNATPTGESGGHLVLIVDASTNAAGDLESVAIHNPNARTRESQENCTVAIERFTAAFAGRGFALWPANA